MNKKYVKKSELGFSLIETIVSFSILGLIVLGITSVYQSNTQLWLKADQQRDIQQNARVALQRMISEIRHAGYVFGNKDPGSGGNGPAITTADQHLITFNAVVRDANKDGVKDNNLDWSVNVDTETITFSIPAGTTKIQRHSVRPGGVTEDMDLSFPAVEVVGLDFEYRESNGTSLGGTYGYPLPTGPPDRRYEVRYVGVTLEVRKGMGREGAATGRETIILRGGTSPPNLR